MTYFGSLRIGDRLLRAGERRQINEPQWSRRQWYKEPEVYQDHHPGRRIS